MTKRGIVTVAMMVAGLTLMVLSYFGGAAPWCADSVDCSNPRWEWASGVFVLGVLLAFSAAIYYEVSKGSRKRSR